MNRWLKQIGLVAGGLLLTQGCQDTTYERAVKAQGQVDPSQETVRTEPTDEGFEADPNSPYLILSGESGVGGSGPSAGDSPEASNSGTGALETGTYRAGDSNEGVGGSGKAGKAAADGGTAVDAEVTK